MVKPIIISNISSQVAETVKKLNIFDIEAVTKEHPKAVTKLSKPKIVTKQYKIDTELKAADRTLQLDFIKDMLFLKNIHSVMKLIS